MIKWVHFKIKVTVKSTSFSPHNLYILVNVTPSAKVSFLSEFSYMYVPSCISKVSIVCMLIICIIFASTCVAVLMISRPASLVVAFQSPTASPSRWLPLPRSLLAERELFLPANVKCLLMGLVVWSAGFPLKYKVPCDDCCCGCDHTAHFNQMNWLTKWNQAKFA